MPLVDFIISGEYNAQRIEQSHQIYGATSQAPPAEVLLIESINNELTS